MNTPTLFLGSSTSGKVGAFGEGVQDFGAAYTCRVRTVQAAPAGLDGASALISATLALRHRMLAADDDPADESTVTVTPYVDEEPGTAVAFTVRETPVSDRSNPPRRIVKRYEAALSEPRMREGQEVSRRLPVGGVVQLDVAWSASEINIDAAVLEHEIITPGLDAVNE